MSHDKHRIHDELKAYVEHLLHKSTDPLAVRIQPAKIGASIGSAGIHTAPAPALLRQPVAQVPTFIGLKIRENRLRTHSAPSADGQDGRRVTFDARCDYSLGHKVSDAVVKVALELMGDQQRHARYNTKRLLHYRIVDRCRDLGLQFPYSWTCRFVCKTLEKARLDRIAARRGLTPMVHDRKLRPFDQVSALVLSLDLEPERALLAGLARCTKVYLLVDDYTRACIGHYLVAAPIQVAPVAGALADCLLRHGRLPRTLAFSSGGLAPNAEVMAVCVNCGIEIVHQRPLPVSPVWAERLVHSLESMLSSGAPDSDCLGHLDRLLSDCLCAVPPDSLRAMTTTLWSLGGAARKAGSAVQPAYREDEEDEEDDGLTVGPFDDIVLEEPDAEMGPTAVARVRTDGGPEHRALSWIARWSLTAALLDDGRVNGAGEVA